jgi:hypothetical protein
VCKTERREVTEDLKQINATNIRKVNSTNRVTLSRMDLGWGGVGLRKRTGRVETGTGSGIERLGTPVKCFINDP